MIDMRIKAGGTPCGCVNCGYQMRSVAAEIGAGGNMANCVDWVNSYDWTANPLAIEWGQLVTAYFPDETYTSYTGTPAVNAATSGLGYPQNEAWTVQWNEGFTACVVTESAVGGSIVAKSQFYLPLPTAYYVIAYGPDISNSETPDCGESANWFAQGCIYPQQADDQYPMIVDLPVPDPSLDDTILVQFYWLGPIAPGAPLPPHGIFGSGNMSILPNLTSITPANAGFTGKGPSWNPNQVCAGPTVDPFNGEAEWDPP